MLEAVLVIVVVLLLVLLPVLMRFARQSAQQAAAVAMADMKAHERQALELNKRLEETQSHLGALQQRSEEERVQAARIEVELRGCVESLKDLQTRLQGAHAQIDTLRAGENARAIAQAQVESARKELGDLSERLRTTTGEREALIKERERLMTDLERLGGELTANRRIADERSQAHEQARVQLKAEFENLANRLFEDKGKAILGEGRQQLDAVLMPLRERLGEFQAQVAKVHETEVRERSSLKSELENLMKVHVSLGAEAQRLSKALTSESRLQGAWGELTLQRLLEASHLQRGIDYELQVSARNDESQLGRPDAVIYLPEGKALVIDAKVSLTAFTDACSMSDDAERQRRLVDHAASVRTHMRTLAGRRYPELLGSKTLDLTLLFLPSEPAFAAAMTQDPTLWLDAFTAQVVLVSPTTLLATLRVAAQVWQMDKQNRNAAQMFGEATKIIDKLAGFVKDLDDVGRSLTIAQRSWDKAKSKLDSGKGNLISRANRLYLLGAKNVKTETRQALIGDNQGEDDGEEKDEGPDDSMTPPDLPTRDEAAG